MSTIAIIGGTGYAGGHIAAEALSRGHRVISVSRNAPAEPVAGVEVRTGSIEDEALIGRLFADADVVVIAIHGAADDKPYLINFVPRLLALAAEHDTRLGVVGGAGSLLSAPDGPLVIDLPQFPAEFKIEASSHARVLAAMRAADTEADWFYVSPAAYFGANAPGERTGGYRTGDDVLVTDAEGNSAIGGADFAIAFVDEIDKPVHRRTRFTVAY
ncbi:NAD(P)-dependent oxidoreductase [Plantactinospora sp. KBS50]|uniref:NAD(P)-dependent oxidoreductase n=1 Tax=Plantactinospora sp. KBS50 TaxID=2024580 RepID=UPI000BAAC4F7|nr:NAD(P)H-binding protein [Plantactinospora sp. KBS50]ASW54708.1 NAD-dependent epimerase [Plantactinospora sp. KBS50]